MVMAFFEWVSSHFSWEVLGAPIAHGLIARRPYQIGAALVVVLFLLLHKSVKKRLSEKSRLHVQPSERPVKLLGSLEATAVMIRNRESRFNYTCFHVKGSVTFMNFHKDTILTSTALISNREGTNVLSSISLKMLETALIGLTTYQNGKFFTISSWPFEQANESELSPGEWQAHVSLTSDADRADGVFRLQLNPDGSTVLTLARNSSMRKATTTILMALVGILGWKLKGK